MRWVLLAVVATGALAACRNNKSKLDADRGGDVDTLWDLAPDGTELGLVASPRAVGLTIRAVDAIRELAQQPDLAPAKPQIDALAKGLFGSETATAADAGFSASHGFAMFATSDGVLGVMPVADRDKFMASKHGQRGSGSADDVLEVNHCREMRSLYVCASDVKLFDRLGKGSLRGKLDAGARGDAELYMKNVTMLGDSKGDLSLVAKLEPGTVEVQGRWDGVPSGPLQQLINISAPHADTTNATGFVSINVKPLLAAAPPIPVAGGVTLDQLGASLAGPISAVIPSGSVDIQIHAPLTDPKPAQTVIEHCTDVGQFFELAKTQTPGACRIVLQGTNQLELDVWVEGNELRLGAHKGAPPQGKPGGMTPIGRSLAASDWTAAFWGRGTMLNLAGIAPASQDVPLEVALGIHAIALVNELGAAAKVDAHGLSFRGYLRTAWTNPPDVFAKIAAITGNDIVTGKAGEPAKSIAAASPASPFAADFAAGQGGLMIPAAAIGVASAVIVPAVIRAVTGAGGAGEQPQGSTDTPQGPPMNNADLTSLLVHAYVQEAYPQWQAENAGKKCPVKLDELAKYFGENPGIPVLADPWGHPLLMKCDDKNGLSIVSVGEDGKEGTPDDVKAP
ncbi:MAG TPA: hypothetical protein VLB44_16030 [Kofleriaceae bacterium]|nr:hypothetical protein [Kofleriaceae bacterium]